MKRVLILFAILTIAALPMFAIDSSFDIGINLSYLTGEDVVDESAYSGMFNIDKIAVGLELRTNISNFQVAINGDLTVLDTESLLFSGIFGVGLCVDMFEYFKVSATLGPKVNYVYKDDVKSVDEEGNLVNARNFYDALADGNFYYRFMVDFLAGPVITMGLACTIPTVFTINQGNYSEILPRREDFKAGQVSLCMQMKLF